MTKQCSRCQKILSENQFNWKIKDVRRATHCRSCSREYIRNHYKNNKEYYLLKARKRNSIIKEKNNKYILQHLLKNPCVDCGEKDILVLEFDHRERQHKTSNIGNLIRDGATLQMIITEIAKCEVRCANCHRRKTEKENNSWKLKHAPVA